MTYRLTGRYPLGDLSGRPGARLRLSPSTTIVGDDNIVLPAPVWVELDADGAFAVDLIGTDDPAYGPSGWVWTVTEEMDGGRPPWSFELTADADLSELAATVPPDEYETLVPTSRAIVAGAGLTGGGALTADRTLDVGAGTGITVAADVVAVDTGVIATRAYADGVGTAAAGALAGHEADTTGVHGIADTSALVLTGDARMSDARTPTAHTHPAAQISDSTTVGRAVLTAADAAAARTAIGAAQAGAAPATHAASHGSAGSDPVTLAQSQVTNLTADLAAKAPLASPALTGNPTAPTQAAGNNSTRLATTAYVDTAAGLLVPKSLYDANSILAATTDDTPTALSVPAGTVVGRNSTGGITTLDAATLRILVDIAQASVLGNLLTAAQSTPTTGVLTLSGCTEASGLVLTATGTGALTASVAGIPVSPGRVYSVRADLTCVGRAAATRISWRNSGGSEISAVAGDTIAAGASGESMATGVAPAGAVTMIAYAADSGTGATADTVTTVRFGVWLGAGGLWMPPGLAVPHLGQRVTRPNLDDVWVRTWSGPTGDPSAAGRWQTAHYDSGVRGVSSLLSADALAKVQTWGLVHLCRVDSRVTLTFSATIGSGTANGTASNITLISTPSGFRHIGYQHGLGAGTYGGRNPIGLHGASTLTSEYLSAPSGLNWGASYIAGECSFLTADAIPTSLPGTLVSAAPA